MEQVRVGILGTSWWADAMYLPALKNHPKASIEAVAGRNLETTRAFASRWEIRKNFENAAELIEKAESCIIAIKPIPIITIQTNDSIIEIPLFDLAIYFVPLIFIFIIF